MKKLKVPLIQSQRDNRWSSIPLGNNTNASYNIGQFGCLITSFANYLGITPVDVNSHKDLFTAGGGDLIWSKVTVLGLNPYYTSPRYEDAVTNQGIAKMKSLIDEGRPLICEIDFNPTTVNEDMHFVLVIGYDDSSQDSETFYAIDPWTGTEIDLSVYGGVRRTLYCFRAYDKVLPFYSEPVVYDEFKKKIQVYFNYEITADDTVKFIDERKAEISNLQSVIGKKDKTIDNLNTQIDTLNKDNSELAKELKDCQKTAKDNASCQKALLDKTQEANQLKLNLEKQRSEYELMVVAKNKEIEDEKQKYEAVNKPLMKLIVDLLFRR